MLYFDKRATFKRRSNVVIDDETVLSLVETYNLIAINFERSSGKLSVNNQLARDDFEDSYTVVVPIEYNDIMEGDEVELFDVIA